VKELRMAVFKPTTTAMFYKRLGFTTYGEPLSAPGVSVGVAVLKFDIEAMQTSRYTEAAASRGRVEDDEAKSAQLLFPANIAVAEDDRVDFYGIGLQVAGVWPSYDSFGRLDHKKVMLKRLELPATDPSGDR
jgi:hypothetical protein